MAEINLMIAGASGLVGKACIAAFCDDPRVGKVISLVRGSSQVSSHVKIDTRVVDFADLSTLSVEEPIAGIFCCLGTTMRKAKTAAEFRKVDLDYVLKLGQWGQQHQVPHFLVISSIGADDRSRFLYTQTKGQMEKNLEAIGFPSLDVFRPSFLLGQRSEKRPGEKISTIIAEALRPCFVGPLEKYRAIKAQTVAQAMLLSFLHAQAGTRIHESHRIESLAQGCA